MKLNFETYREQMQQQSMSPESVERIRKQLQTACAQGQHDSAIKTKMPAAQKLLPLAACLILALGMGFIVPVTTNEPPDRSSIAIAHAPLLPNERLEIEPSYGVIDNGTELYSCVDMKIVDPAIQNHPYTLELKTAGNAGIYYAGIKPAFETTRTVPPKQIFFTVGMKPEFVYYQGDLITTSEYDRLFRESAPKKDPDHVLQLTIDELRNLQFVVTTETMRITYIVDFSQYSDHFSIGSHIRRTTAGMPVTFKLNKEIELL